MKMHVIHYFRFLLVTSFLFMTSTLTFNLQAQSKDELKVAEAVKQLRQAMLDGDKAGLEKITSENLSYGHSTGKMEDKAAFVDALASKRSDFVTMDLSDQSIHIIDKVALVRHNLNAETNDNGKAGTTKLGVLLVWHKEKGQWKLLARQAFKLL